MVSDALVEEIRERAEIVELLGEYMPLKRSGRTWRGPCPLHGGEGPNFSVDPARNLFKCFVCGEGGDVFAFFMKHLGLDFPSAVRHVASRVGMEVPEDREVRDDPFGPLREVVAFAEEWFRERLQEENEGDRARTYLAGRGFREEDVERFGLGWAPDRWRGLREAAAGRGISDDQLLEAGLLATSERAEEPYDRFRGRLIFPIHDLRDRPVAFGGRILSAESDAVPKYINSPESPIFHKGRTLYGLVWARHEIRREDASILSEGYMDALALHRHGFATAVAPLGTSLTTEQAELLGRYGRKVFLLYDSDDAGLKATFRAGDTLLASGLHPMVVTLPQGEDPDSLLQSEGPGALTRLIGDAVDVLERKLQILERHGLLDSIEGRRRAVDGLLSTLRAVRDPALQDLYLARAAERTGVRRETLVREVARARSELDSRERSRRASTRGGSTTTHDTGEARTGFRSEADAAAERGLLLLFLRDRSLIERSVERGLSPGHFRQPGLRSIYSALLESDPEQGTASIAETLEPEQGGMMRRLLKDSTELVHPGDVYEEALRRLLHRERLERLGQIDRELDLADAEQARQLLAEKSDIARELRAAGVPLSFVRNYAVRTIGSAG
ncbi:MAG: DNA primase [marine benthic group bacterium]|nr:DNA primase [Gemmatimonadota bacterium]